MEDDVGRACFKSSTRCPSWGHVPSVLFHWNPHYLQATLQR